MRLIRYKLGDLIIKSDLKNKKEEYKSDSVRGISINKCFAPTKADVNNINLKAFKIVKPNYFAFNTATSRNGEKISIAFNDSDETIIVSSLYDVFCLNEDGKKVLDETYLYMYFNRGEFDRYARNDSWGSAREYFRYSNMCDVEIDLPPKDIQIKFAKIYKNMVENQKLYENGLSDLKLVCDGYLDKIKNSRELIPIGDYIDLIDNRNVNNEKYAFKGLSMENHFIDSIANEVGIDFSKYKIVKPEEFACVLMKVGRDCRLTVAKNNSNENYIISPAYYTFKVEGINHDYFMSYINRSEFERRSWFSCDTSLRGSLPWEEFCNLMIPNASKEEQLVISNIYDVIMFRTKINDKMKALIKNLCPLLIKGSQEYLDKGEEL